MKEGHIFTEGVMDDDYPNTLRSQLKSLPIDTEKIIHHISSPGGSVYAGYKGFHVLKSFGKKIHSIIEGEAQSMATFMAYAGDTVEIKNPSVWMIHNPSQGVQGDADMLEGGASELRKIEDEMAQVYSQKTKIPVEEIKAMMKKTTVLNATEAKRLGFVDTITDPLKAVAIGKTMKHEDKSILKKIGEIIMTAVNGTPTAIDLKTKSGQMINVQSENGDLVGKTVTLDGKPAEGSYELEDGRMLICTGGVVTEVKEATAPPPAETEAQKLAKRVQELETALAAEQAKANTATQTLTAEQTKAKEAETQTAKMLAEVKSELEKLKSEEIGDTQKPMEAIEPRKSPSMAGPQASEKERTMRFFREHMNWIFQYYPEEVVAKYASGPNMVSILETNFNYTYPGILTTEIFYKPTLQSPALSDIFTIDQGISFQKKYNLVTQLDKILRPYTGCDRVFNGNRQLITNTTVVTKEFQVSESWCKDDFTGQLTGVYNNLAQEWLKTGNKSFDPSGTPINTIIDKVLTDALQRDVFRRVSFAAGNSSDVDYNQFDGLWDRLIDSSGASNYCVVRAGSALGTGALSAGTALTALEAVYANSNILLKNAPGKVFWVTRSVWDNYYNSLIGTGAVTEQAFENLQKGLTTLTYKGIPVRPVDLWDSFLAESDNPLTATTRHLILLTIKDNHILGVEQGSDLNKIEGWYERKDRKFYYEADMKFGYNYLHCDLQTIAY